MRMQSRRILTVGLYNLIKQIFYCIVLLSITKQISWESQMHSITHFHHYRPNVTCEEKVHHTWIHFPSIGLSL